MAEINIQLPGFDYMSQKNTYSGSIGDFRYKFFPVKKDDIETVFVAAVYRDNCFEVEDDAGRTVKAEFPYEPDGIVQAQEWIVGQYQMA